MDATVPGQILLSDKHCFFRSLSVLIWLTDANTVRYLFLCFVWMIDEGILKHHTSGMPAIQIVRRFTAKIIKHL